MEEIDDLNLAGLLARIFPANSAAKIGHVISILLSHDTPPSTWYRTIMGKRKRKVSSCNGLHFPLMVQIPNIVHSLQGESGVATSYISRNQALKKLQLSLPDFR